MNEYSMILVIIVLCSAIFQSTCEDEQIGQNRLEDEDINPFGVIYSKVFPHEVQGYKALILESQLYTSDEVQLIKEKEVNAFAYLSLGEVNESRWYFDELQEIGFLGQNEFWGSYFIDLKNERVKNLYIEEVIPRILEKGFDGLFLDTIDAVAPYTPRSEYKTDMVKLINEIRDQFPDIVMIQNGGDFLLSEVENSIDGYAKEDIASAYDFNTSSYNLEEEGPYNVSVASIRAIQENFKLPILIIDFADSDSLATQITQRLDTTGFNYFISTIELNKLPLIHNTNR